MLPEFKHFAYTCLMRFEDRYNTIAKPSEGSFREKDSRFIAYAYPVSREEQIKGYINALKAQHPKARHHCWAVRFTPDRTVFRYNDDGEPAGTAGRPILHSLLSHDLTNTLVVVVRYFGGTLLGVPGLINAYKMATLDALNSAETIQLSIRDIYSITFEYLQTNDIMKIVKEHHIKIKQQTLTSGCSIETEIPKSLVNVVIPKLEKLPGIKITYLRTI